MQLEEPKTATYSGDMARVYFEKYRYLRETMIDLEKLCQLDAENKVDPKSILVSIKMQVEVALSRDSRT